MSKEIKSTVEFLLEDVAKILFSLASDLVKMATL